MEQPHNAPRPESTPKPGYARNIRNPFILAALPGDNTLWKYVGGSLVILGFFLFGQTPLAVGMTLFAMLNNLDIQAISDPVLLAEAGFDKNLYLFLAILMFVVGDLGIWVVVKFMHHRRFLSLITPLTRLNWKKIFTAFFIYLLLTATVEGIGYALNPENYVMQFRPGNFIVLFLVTVLVMPFQTSFEELFFRGYLMQGFSFLFRSTLPALFITSLLFALMHSWNPEVSKFGFWVMLPYYFSFGLLLGFIALKDQSLEISLAVHAANNMFGSLFLTFEGSALQTDALFLQKEMDPSAMMPFYIACMLVFLLICSFVFGWWKKAGTHSIPAL